MSIFDIFRQRNPQEDLEERVVRLEETVNTLSSLLKLQGDSIIRLTHEITRLTRALQGVIAESERAGRKHSKADDYFH